METKTEVKPEKVTEDELKAVYLANRLVRAIEQANAIEQASVGRSTPAGVHAKLAAAMGEIEAVAKRGWNDNQKYRFVQAGDLANAAREILAKHCIDIEPCPVGEPTVVREITTKSGTVFHLYRVLIDWSFVDGETGEKAGPYRFAGEGMDSGDKGVYKAYTGSLKYLLKLKFLIPDTGDDPEVANEHDRDVAEEREPQARGVAGAKDRLRKDREREDEGGSDPGTLEAAYKAKVKDQLLALGMSEFEATAWVVGVIGKDRLTRAWTPAERSQIDAGVALLIAKSKNGGKGEEGTRP